MKFGLDSNSSGSELVTVYLHLEDTLNKILGKDIRNKNKYRGKRLAQDSLVFLQ